MPRPKALTFVCLLVAISLLACEDDQTAENSQSVEDISEPDTRKRRPPADAPSPVTWADCGDGFQCGSVPAPRDYDHPRRGTIDVALIRRPASDPAARIGSLLVNPGGPGASGVEFVRGYADVLPDELQARFDIVGFDPRGTGGTLPIDCEVDLDEFFALDTTPDDTAERAAIERTYTAFADACGQRHGDDLALISSQDTVRDMDRVRAALGDQHLTYLGISYGTYLGALYADAYPKRVRAMLLDGAIDPTLDGDAVAIQQAVGFEQALEAFFADCAADTGCAFHSDGDPAAAFDALLADIDTNGVPAADSRVLGPGQADSGVAAALYSGADGYVVLATALAAAADGDGSALLALSDAYTGRDDDGSYDNLFEAFWAIGCLDGGLPAAGGAEQRRLEQRAATAAPHFGVSSVVMGQICRAWPVRPVAEPGPLRAAGSPPILVINTTGDPATPLVGAEALADHLHSGVLVVVESSEHGSFALGGNACVDEIGVRYLVDLDVPAEGTMCG
jgi:pimeloyl-ACP methyl ester carboxylesterase